MLTDLKLLSLSRPGINMLLLYRLQAQMIVHVAAEMYAIRYVSRQMVHVEVCDSAEGFVFEEGPATNSVYCIHYYCCLQILVWQIRKSGYTCIFS